MHAARQSDWHDAIDGFAAGGTTMRIVAGAVKSKHWLTAVGCLLLLGTCSKDRGPAVCGGTSGSQPSQGGASGNGDGAPGAAGGPGAGGSTAGSLGAGGSTTGGA